MLNLLCKVRKLSCILGIRPISGKLTGDGVFRNGGNCRNHLKTGLLCSIRQFYQRILIGTVSIDAYQNSTSTVAMHHTHPLCSHSGNAAAVRRHGNDRDIRLCQRNSMKILLAVSQINGGYIPSSALVK